MEALALALGVLQLGKQVIPLVQQLFQKGQITADQQKKILKEYNDLKAAGDAAFSGEEWQIEPD